jgi:hypothetical protein
MIADFLTKADTRSGRLHQWFQDRPDVGVGVVLEGLLAIDFDVRNGRGDVAEWKHHYGDDLPPTVTSWSGRGDGGMHMIYRLPLVAPITSPKVNAVLNGRITTAIEFKANAGALVLPPSIHEAGNPYRWDEGASPEEREIALAPGWLIHLVQEAVDAYKGKTNREGKSLRTSNKEWADQAEHLANVPNEEFLDAEEFAHFVADHTGGSVQRAGRGYLTNCPVHGDEKPSLSVGTGRDGQTVFNCKAEECSFDDVLDELNVPASRLYPMNKEVSEPTPVKEETVNVEVVTLTELEGIDKIVEGIKRDVRLLGKPEVKALFQLAGEDDVMRLYVNQQLQRSGIRLEEFWDYVERVQTITEPLSPRQIIERLETAPKDRLVDRMLPASGFSLCAARPKVGKSTLMRNLIASILQGGEFLGRKVLITGPVLYYCLEETLFDSWNHLARLGVTMDAPLILRRGSVGPREFRVMLRRDLKEYKPVLVVVDPMVRVLGVEDFNGYGGADKAMTPLVEMTREQNAHIMMVHHCNKMAQNLDLESVLGSTAFAGAVDAAIIMGREAETEKRFVRTFTRYLQDEPIERSEVILDKENGTTVLGAAVKATVGKKKQADLTKLKKNLEDYLYSGLRLTRTELYEFWTTTKPTGKKWVDEVILLGALDLVDNPETGKPDCLLPVREVIRTL